MAEERVRASSSSSSLLTLNRPKGLEDTEPSHCPDPDSQGPHCHCVTHSYRLCPAPSSSSHCLAHPVLTYSPLWPTLVLVPSHSLQTRKIIWAWPARASATAAQRAPCHQSLWAQG